MRLALFLSVFVIVNGCVTTGEHDRQVNGYLQLLTSKEPPTLKQASQYSGECGGEAELSFTLKECQSRGWSEYSEECVRFSENRCKNADSELSYNMRWIRDKFSTAGKSYSIISVTKKDNGFSHNLVEVNIGSNTFLIFRNLHPNVPTGLLVGISKVNDKNLSELKGE